MPQQQSCWKCHLHLLFLLAGSRQQVAKIGGQGREGETSSWPGIAFQMKSFHQTDRGWILARGKMAKLLLITYFSDWLISNSFGKKISKYIFKICSCCEYRALPKILVLIAQCPKTLSSKRRQHFSSLPLVWACLGLSPNPSAWTAGVMG